MKEIQLYIMIQKFIIQTYQFNAEMKVIKKRTPDERTSLTRLFERRNLEQNLAPLSMVHTKVNLTKAFAITKIDSSAKSLARLTNS